MNWLLRVFLENRKMLILLEQRRANGRFLSLALANIVDMKKQQVQFEIYYALAVASPRFDKFLLKWSRFIYYKIKLQAVS